MIDILWFTLHFTSRILFLKHHSGYVIPLVKNRSWLSIAWSCSFKVYLFMCSFFGFQLPGDAFFMQNTRLLKPPSEKQIKRRHAP